MHIVSIGYPTFGAILGVVLDSYRERPAVRKKNCCNVSAWAAEAGSVHLTHEAHGELTVPFHRILGAG